VDGQDYEPRLLPVGVRVVPIERRLTTEPLRIEGRVAASRAVQMKAPTSGIVRDLEVQLGSKIQKGEVICTIGAEAQRQRALATQSQLHLVKAQLEERMDGLAQVRGRGESEERIASFEAKVRAGQNRVEQETTNVKRHALAADLVKVRAPFDARVAAVSSGPGASIVSGHLLIELVEIDPAILVLELPTWVASRCKIGMAVSVTTDSHREPLEARVARWAPTANDGFRRLLIDIPNPDGTLAAGERGVATIDVGERTAFFAPRVALVREKKATKLHLVEHSVARIRSVRVVGGDETSAEVAGDLDASQLVVLHAERKLEESCEVVIRGDH